VTLRERELEAPHRRLEPGPRILEKTGVAAYRSASRLLGVLPPGPPRVVLARLAQASYLLWPTRRRWSNRNFGHILGLPPDHPRVRALALDAYAEYGRYLVELMRLPSRKADERDHLAGDLDVEAIQELRDRSRGGIILAAAHVGNNEAVAASIAHHGMPISVVADDSTFPELFEHLRRQREGWGIKVIAWRNLRGIFNVLRNREMLALLLDWGYRSDGIPVQLFGAWTTLPAGPATLAAKTGSMIVAVRIGRRPDGKFGVSWSEPIEVASNDPAELQRATQAMADELEVIVGLAPEQWYSFKPLWPASPDAAADLERRARIMQAGQPDPGPAGRRRDAAELAVEGA
jgi:phosphatidylinositol dimannoside acyltransferase